MEQHCSTENITKCFDKKQSKYLKLHARLCASNYTINVIIIITAVFIVHLFAFALSLQAGYRLHSVPDGLYMAWFLRAHALPSVTG